MKKFLFVFTIFLIFSGFSYAQGEIQLVNAEITSYIRGGTYGQGTAYKSTFVVKVKNIGYHKNVSVYYASSNGWKDLKLTYKGPAENGCEIWKGEKLDSSIREFVLRYGVNGTTYWDNNNNSNYKIGSGNQILGKGINVLLDSFAFIPGYSTRYLWTSYTPPATFSGVVTVRNLAYAKEVTIVYTTDKWKTTKVLPAVFLSSNATGDLEKWKFYITLGMASNVEFAIAYDLPEITYWDNNFGSNY